MRTPLDDSHLIAIIKETLQGNDEHNSAFGELPNEIKLSIAKNLIKKNSDDTIKDNYWKILYHRKPPSITEFLSEEWIGDIAKDIYPVWKKHLPNIFDPSNIINELILYGAIGQGKSFVSSLISLYIMILLWFHKNPYAFYARSPLNPFCFFLSSFSEKKGKQVVLKPILNALESIPMFQKVKYESQLLSKQEYGEGAPILYTQASTVGCISLSRNLHYAMGSNVSHQLGLTLVGALVSEINFFVDQGGVSKSDIWNYYSTLKTRIFNRFGKVYGAMLILDSSANDIENPIEEYILGDAKNNKNTFITSDTHWDALPPDKVKDIYPKYYNTGETFDVFKGLKGQEPFIIGEENPNEEVEINDADVLKVPIDTYNEFDTDIYTALKDLAGIPTGAKTRFFTNEKFLNEMFNCNLKSCPTIEAPISKEPKDLIFNQIVETGHFFDIDLNGKLYPKRASGAPRALHFDLATSDKGKNRAGCCTKHFELDKQGRLIAVTDFSFPVSGAGEQISLQAMEDFLYDLIFKGNMNVTCVSADGFQSSQLLQNIQRKFQARIKSKNFFCKLVSCDREKAQYYLQKTYILQGKQKNAKSVELLNNYTSLQELPKKIDHTDGDVADSKGNYTGKNAKDISDAEAGALYHLSEHYESSDYIYEDCEMYDKKQGIQELKATFKNQNVKEGLSLADIMKKEAIEKAKKLALQEIHGRK